MGPAGERSALRLTSLAGRERFSGRVRHPGVIRAGSVRRASGLARSHGPPGRWAPARAGSDPPRRPPCAFGTAFPFMPQAGRSARARRCGRRGVSAVPTPFFPYLAGLLLRASGWQHIPFSNRIAAGRSTAGCPPPAASAQSAAAWTSPSAATPSSAFAGGQATPSAMGGSAPRE